VRGDAAQYLTGLQHDPAGGVETTKSEVVLAGPSQIPPGAPSASIRSLGYESEPTFLTKRHGRRNGRRAACPRRVHS
jgi:hypothetical protein